MDALRQPEVHFTNPFRFPVYNTGAESVLSIVLHRAMSGVSLYWSNTVVVAVYDVLLLAGLGVLFRLVYRDAFVEAAAWMLTAMSTALLTFLALSAFNVQAYATLVAGLAGCELMLQSWRRSGIALLALAFLCISQAYPLTFFLPLFCLVWTSARGMMALSRDDADGRLVLRRAGAVLVAVLACVLVVEVVSLGTYLEKAFGVVRDPLEWQKKEPSVALSIRMADLLRLAFWPDGSEKSPWPGFAPYFAWLTLVLAAVASVFVRRKERSHDVPPNASLVPDLLKPWLSVAAWSGLVVFGYLPAMFGTSLKSQRCVFGDLFLAMALAAWIAWLLRRGAARRAVAAMLVALLAASDVVYARAFLGQDHSDVHSPIFDYDVADGVARHDIDATLDYMGAQARRRNAALLVYYPSGKSENTTDPTMFHARFLRRIGSWQRAHWIFPCRFCETRYGCPFPDVVRRNCRRECCYFDPVKTIEAFPALARRRMLVWWFDDVALHDVPRRERVLKRLRHRYRIKDLATPAPERRWHVYELTPRDRASNAKHPNAHAQTRNSKAPNASGGNAPGPDNTGSR
jgi:hypothetical protein